ncbi:hypothetical protein [Flavobacterium sp. 316]|uniref:hypothetical protein n=1 Tax=Flavobacterium sp. 316 TaxID=1603293 RepID=UPI00137927FE|nr:hypothetical protein [Flavobacterium sp. 316]
MNYIGVIIVSAIILILAFIIYTINFGIPTSDKIINKIESNKESLSYSKEYFIINIPILEKKLKINWESIEAIFLLNKPPLDGEYHNFEYIIIMNKDPEIMMYNNQKWYNRYNLLSVFPKSNKKKLPCVKINDYSNKNFNTFKDAIDKYLVKTKDYLNLKFGNETKEVISGNIKIVTLKSPIKTFGFYKVFDLGNDLKDEKLIEYRNEVKIKNEND